MIVVVAFLWAISILLLKRMSCSVVFRKKKKREGGEDGRNGMNLKIMAEMPAQRGRLACPPYLTSF